MTGSCERMSIGLLAVALCALPKAAFTQILDSHYAHTLAVCNDHTVQAWGDNEHGQLGNGTTTDSAVPLTVPGLTNAISVAVGRYHSLALKQDGTVWAWGENSGGELGTGTIIDVHTPVQIGSLSDVVAIAAGFKHSLALKSDGSVWTWGQNSYGVLGGTTTDAYSTVPLMVEQPTSVASIAAGWYHSLAVTVDGFILAWGDNYYDQLGLGYGAPNSSSIPDTVVSINNVSMVTGGLAFSAALKFDGTVWAWGSNNEGQLGDGTNMGRYAPVQVNSLTNILQIDAGSEHLLALHNDGVVSATGANWQGQLGNGEQISSNIPVQVASLDNIAVIAGGRNHSLALEIGGPLWAWGAAELGDTLGAISTVPFALVGTCPMAVAVNEYQEEPSFELFPDPTTALCTIRTENTSKWFIVVRNGMGEIIQRCVAYQPVHSLDLGAAPPGIYMISISAGVRTHTRKLVKE